MNTSDLDYIYNVKCPVCGYVPGYEITGENSYNEINCCGHEELNALIHQRENEFLAKGNRQQDTSYYRITHKHQ